MIDNDRPPARQTDEPVRPGLPVLPPLVAFAEILVLLVVPAALDYLWPAFPSLTEMQPHFFWLPVLLLSLQYGTVSGLLAAGVAIGLSLWLGWPDQEVGENHFSYLLRVWTQPVLWVAAALLLGQFRMRQIEQKQELALEVAQLSSQRTAIADYATNLRTRCETLERELASGRGTPARQLLDALADARAGKPAIDAAFGACLAAAFGPCRGSLYVMRDSGLYQMAAFGAVAGSTSGAPPVAGTLVQAVLGDGRSLSVLVPGDEAMLAGDGIVAVPIMVEGDKRVIGMLKLDALQPGELDAGTVARATVVASQLAPALLAGAGTQVTSLGKPAPKLRLWRQVKWRRLKPQDAAQPLRASRVG